MDILTVPVRQSGSLALHFLGAFASGFLLLWGLTSTVETECVAVALDASQSYSIPTAETVQPTGLDRGVAKNFVAWWMNDVFDYDHHSQAKSHNYAQAWTTGSNVNQELSRSFWKGVPDHDQCGHKIRFNATSTEVVASDANSVTVRVGGGFIREGINGTSLQPALMDIKVVGSNETGMRIADVKSVGPDGMAERVSGFLRTPCEK